MEVHACGLIVEGGAVLFCGQSGAGKSTTARLWRRHRAGTRILSDDRIAVRSRRGRFWAHGTPWHGDGGFASSEGGPLRAVFFLKHAKRTRLVPLAVADAASRLYARTFPPPWDAAAVARVLESCGRVAAEVPCYELPFRPDAGAVGQVLRALEGT
jgi:energy-coupling factor transporter ATP-binding protein EcfA2